MAKASAVVEEQEETDGLFNVPTTLKPETYMVKCNGLYEKDWEKPNSFNPDKPNISIMWKFNFSRVLDDGTLDVVVDATSNQPLEREFPTTKAISAKSKAFKWATALLRHPPSAAEIPHLNRLVTGKKAMAVVGQKENGYPEIVDMFPAVGVKD